MTVPVSVAVAATLEVPIANQSAWIKTLGGGLVLLVAIFLFAGPIELVGAVAGSYLVATGLRDLRRERA